MSFHTLQTALGTVQPVPGAATAGVSQPLPATGDMPSAPTAPGPRFIAAQADEQPSGSAKRSHVNAPLSGRLPVQATRCQDRSVTANEGVPLTTENGVKIVHPGSTLR